MKRMSASTRLSIGITCLTMSLLLAAQGLGVIPSPTEAALKSRKSLCESLAIHCSVAAQRDDVETIKATAQAVIERDPDVMSIGLRTSDGKLVAAAGDHATNWKDADSHKSTATHVRVP